MYRCKFSTSIPFNAAPEIYHAWQQQPDDGGLPLCPLAYRLCHSPCDAMESRHEELQGQIEGSPDQDESWLRPLREVAGLVGIPYPTLAQAVREERVRGRQINGKAWMVRLADVRRAIESGTLRSR